MKMYLVMAMRKPAFNADAVAPHKAFLDGLAAEGRLHLTGGFSDGSGGAYVLKNVADLDEAKVIVARDPLVLMDSSELTVHEWNTR